METHNTTSCLTFVNQLLDIHLLYSRGQQRVKQRKVGAADGERQVD